MITILHGTDIASSRDVFFEAKNNAQNPNLLEGENLTFEQLFQTIENKSLFDVEIKLFIENFLTKNKSNTTEFKKIAKYLNDNKYSSVFLWENSEITKTTLSQFPNADIKVFSLPKNLFLFLDNIKPNNSNYLIKLFHELGKSSETELIFFMILRQFRLLLGSIDTNNSIDEIKRLAPWQLSKFKKQLSYFTKENLIESYNKLFSIDLGQKTGGLSGNLTQAIDFFLLDL